MKFLVSILIASLCAATALAEKIDIPLKLQNEVFNFKEHGLVIHLKTPVQLHETFIKNKDVDSYTYSSETGRFSFNLSVIKPTAVSYDELIHGKFTELILKPFSDKKNHLYGEYEILQDSQRGADKNFEYEGYLKTPAAGVPNGRYLRLRELYMLRKGQIVKVSCTVQGLQDENSLTEELYDKLSSSCSEIIGSVKVEK